jgi:hypothetical protein
MMSRQASKQAGRQARRTDRQGINDSSKISFWKSKKKYTRSREE